MSSRPSAKRPPQAGPQKQPLTRPQSRRRVRLLAGIKTDPIEYRYSFEWLFRILAEEGVRHVQLGTFFELYQLPDEAVRGLRRTAEDHGVEISSVFTSHRELGGFLRDDPAWEEVALRGYERLVEIGAILGARSVGSSAGSVLRDRMGTKAGGVACYARHLKALLHRAHRLGVGAITVEPMSCLAEPPTLPGEIRDLLEDLAAYHRDHADDTAAPGLCFDVSHGYADRGGHVRHGPMELLEVSLPWIRELHLRNTDERFGATFGFSKEERRRGVVDLRAVRDRLISGTARLPVDELVGYFEVPGPKLGRDWSDGRLESEIRESLRHIHESFVLDGGSPAKARRSRSIPMGISAEPPSVVIAPSMMCADMGNVEEEVRRLEDAGCEWLHFDIMDGHFVPNMPVGLVLLEDVRRLTGLAIDVHLMVEDNDAFVRLLEPIGVQHISVHVESAIHLDRTLQLIKSTGAKAGAALNPATPLSALDYVLEHLDYILVMTVNPGYAGQTLVPSAIRKIGEARDYLDRRGMDVPIQVDGNVSFENIPRMVAAGAGILVAGSSSLFHRGGSRRENIARVREGVASGLARRRRKKT